MSNRLRLNFKNCPRCGAKLLKAESFSGTDSEFWLACESCPTYVNTYIPQEHQAMLHRDTHTIIGNFGGYGSGKTLTSREEVMKHMFITNNANVAVGANVASQYEQTIKRELEMDIPKAFVKDSSVQKATMDLLNGSRLMWRSFDDPGKLRSLNLSMFVIVEGSETTGEVLAQLKTRSRNTATIIYKRDENGEMEFDDNDKPIVLHDWRKGIIESNPDSGYIRTEILLASDVINQFGSTEVEKYDQDPKRIDPLTSSYVTATAANKYLPANYEEMQAKNKPEWWIKRYLKGSFRFSEGLVYPAFSTTIIEPFKIPDHWKRVLAFDYGLSDKASFVLAAIDQENGMLYIYKNETTTNMNIRELSDMYRRLTADIVEGGMAFTPLIDPKSAAKRDYNKKTLYDLFAEEGIYFNAGTISVDTRVFRLNTYIESGRVKVFNTCEELIEEMREYKFYPKTLDGTSNRNTDKPMDKNNHSINPLEWIVTALPSDPSRMSYGVYNNLGLTQEQVENQELDMPWQLQDAENSWAQADEFQTPSFNLL